MAITDALSALQNLTSNARNPQGLVQQFLDKQQRLDEMKRNLSMAGQTGPYGFATGAQPFDIADVEGDLNSDPNFGTEARKSADNAQKDYENDVRYNTPEATKQRNDLEATKIAESTAAPNAAAAGALAVAKENNAAKLAEQNNQNANTMQLLTGMQGGGQGNATGGIAGPGGTIKPTINASGGVSFTTTQMPALVQRARNQLLDAHSKTLEALQQAEKMYSGINDQVSRDESQGPEGSTGFLNFLTGVGAPKYGSAMDMAGARAERAKYDLGIPTPFSELAQASSFGNIEQMAGQLPGVRGLATITPLFKEHQSHWGHETPYQTVRRLHGMAKMMEDTIHTLDTSGANTLADIIAASRAAKSTYAGDTTPLGDVSTANDIPEFLRPPSQQFSNADLTPAARRKAAGVEDVAPADDPLNYGRGGYNPTPNGPVESEQDRLLAEAKGTLASAQKFADPIESAGNRAAMDSLAQDPLHAALNAGFENFGRGMRGLMSPTSVIKGAAGAIPAAVKGVAGGLAQIPEGVQAEWDILHNLPDTVRGVVNDIPQYAKDLGGAIASKENEWAANPEQGGNAVAELLGASAAPDAALGALKYGPKAAGTVATKLGEGSTAIGEKVKGLGKWSGPTAAMGHPMAAAAELAAPPALRGLGGALQRGGAKLSALDIPASLRALGQTDVMGPINRTLTPANSGLTPEAESVAATVRAAKDMVAGGMSRGAAAQRAGWPLAGDFELNAAGQPVNKYGVGDFGTHPGQNVTANHPYQPGITGIKNAIEGPKTFADSVRAEARRTGAPKAAEPVGSAGVAGFIDDAANLNARRDSGNYDNAIAAFERANPSPLQTGIGAGEPMSPELMNRVVEAARRERVTKPGNLQGVNLANANLGDLAEAHRTVDYARGKNVPDQVDLSSHVNPEDALAKLSRKRANARSHRNNAPRSSGY